MYKDLCVMDLLIMVLRVTAFVVLKVSGGVLTGRTPPQRQDVDSVDSVDNVPLTTLPTLTHSQPLPTRTRSASRETNKYISPLNCGCRYMAFDLA